uniref:Uncharacterized protein n=1 Tax=Zea mays TaxID=4577 RepID=B8A353_MAIZE|nr:unknown [Zea mays]
MSSSSLGGRTTMTTSAAAAAMPCSASFFPLSTTSRPSLSRTYTPSSTTSFLLRLAMTSTGSSSLIRHGSLRPSASSTTTASSAASATGPHPGTTAQRAHALSTSTTPRPTSVLARLGADSMAATPPVSLTTGSRMTVVASATSP